MLKWVKTTNGYYAESRFGNYAAERTAGGKFVCRLDGVDEYGNKPTTLAQVKEICQTLDDDRSGRVASAGPQPSSSSGPAPVEAQEPTTTVVLSLKTEVPAPTGGQHGTSPVDGDGRNMTAERIVAAEATWEPTPTPAPTGLVARLSQPRPVDTAPHLLVEARAGTGKTTTLVGALKVLKGIDPGITPSPQQKAVWDSVALSAGVAKTACFVAFNKSIAEELKSRVPQGCDAMTLHGMGFRAVRNAFPRVRVEQYRVSNIIGEVLGRDVRELRRTKAALVRVIEELVGLCKMNLTDPTPEALLDLVSYYEIDTEGASVHEAFELVPRVLDRCRDVAADGCIDFDDMVWLPVALGLLVYRYDLLMVDEAQDLNRCQQALAKVAGSRLVLCGDPKQAIYGFAGADALSMKRLEDELGQTPRGCRHLPLTVTRRCGKAIVGEANRIVPDFEAHETNGEGAISRHTMKTYAPVAADGDMVLCRVNAPLVSECFKFLRAGRKANILGRDIGQGLISTVTKLKATTVAELIGKLGDWLDAEIRKENAKKNPSEARVIGLQDRHDCLLCFTEGLSATESPEAVVRKIEFVFTDDKTKPGIRLSSIHKSKGLEARRVFLLEPEGATVPHPMAKSAWQREQEMNLRYVAITRAINELVFVG